MPDEPDEFATLDYASWIAPRVRPVDPRVIRARRFTSWRFIGAALLIMVIGVVLLPWDAEQNAVRLVMGTILLCVGGALLCVSAVAGIFCYHVETKQRVEDIAKFDNWL